VAKLFNSQQRNREEKHQMASLIAAQAFSSALGNSLITRLIRGRS
jgi:hypothetical protein